LAGQAGAVTTDWAYDFTGYAPAGDLESVFGPMVASLDAKVDTTFSFGGPTDPYRSLNLISQVFQADAEVTIGTGEGGTEITLQPGDHTFAYTLDYTAGLAGTVDSELKDFQLFRVVDDQVFNYITNPGPFMALQEVIGGACNTAAGFDGPALVPYDQGITATEVDGFMGMVLQTSKAQFSWPQDDQVSPGTKAMVFLFTTGDVDIMQIGWDGTDTGEGANVLAAGKSLDNIPALIPVPEPAGVLCVLLGGMVALRRRRRRS
jgi:hypothetical protein